MTSTSAQLVFENSGKPWAPQEDKLLIDEYNAGTNVDDICKIHKRNMGGIGSRLKLIPRLKHLLNHLM